MQILGSIARLVRDPLVLREALSARTPTALLAHSIADSLQRSSMAEYDSVGSFSDGGATSLSSAPRMSIKRLPDPYHHEN